MRNLWRLLEVLTGQRFRNYLMAEANDLHNRAAALTRCIIAVGILAVMLNLFGLKMVNFYLSILVNIIMIIIMTRPSILLTIGVIGAVADQSLEGGKELLKKAAEVYAHTLLYISICFLFTGIFSFQNNPGAIAMVIAALLVTFWMDKAGWFKPKFYRKAIYVFANCVIIFGILSFIPRAGFIKIVGFYPYSFLTITELEDKVSDVEEVERKAIEKVAIEKLEGIEEKIDDGQKLSEEEKKFWDEQKALRNGNTIFSRAKNSVSGLFSSSAPAPVVQAKNEIPTVTYKRDDQPTFQIAKGQYSNYWISPPKGIGYMEFQSNKGSYYEAHFKSGLIVKISAGEEPSYPIKEPFRLYAVEDSDIRLVFS